MSEVILSLLFSKHCVKPWGYNGEQMVIDLIV